MTIFCKLSGCFFRFLFTVGGAGREASRARNHVTKLWRVPEGDRTHSEEKNFICVLLLCFLLLFQSNAQARLGNKVNENQRQYGSELVSKQFSDGDRKFSGKKTYKLPLYGWQVEAIYKDGRSFSEAARPRGNKFKQEMISEKEANVIADMLYPRKERGRYRKQIKNAHFISHFFEYGVVSYEMKLDKKGKNHLGVIGVRTVLYSDGRSFKSIKVNAYH